jgi:hypothetical protein
MVQAKTRPALKPGDRARAFSQGSGKQEQGIVVSVDVDAGTCRLAYPLMAWPGGEGIGLPLITIVAGLCYLRDVELVA